MLPEILGEKLEKVELVGCINAKEEFNRLC